MAEVSQILKPLLPHVGLKCTKLPDGEPYKLHCEASSFRLMSSLLNLLTQYFYQGNPSIRRYLYLNDTFQHKEDAKSRVINSVNRICGGRSSSCFQEASLSNKKVYFYSNTNDLNDKIVIDATNTDPKLACVIKVMVGCLHYIYQSIPIQRLIEDIEKHGHHLGDGCTSILVHTSQGGEQWYRGPPHECITHPWHYVHPRKMW